MTRTPNIELYNCDCMELMARYPDNHFDLAIVDPPYGLNEKLTRGGGNHLKFKDDKRINNWDVIPDDKYFNELFRISNNQIIWGGNYFDLPIYRCPIIWNKQQPLSNFSSFELAWTSFDRPNDIFSERQAGFCGDTKIHPTQKPVKLYKWLLKNYAKEGDAILDTHLGSGSIAIACWDMGFDLVGSEIDKDYYEAMMKRFEQHKSQLQLAL